MTEGGSVRTLLLLTLAVALGVLVALVFEPDRVIEDNSMYLIASAR
jgi:hypothetical protein